jgi:hypothetical protein
MTTARAIALASVAAFVIAFVTAPAGSSASPTCGPIAQIRDPGLRASFAKFEAQQSAAASKACALHRNARF